jgi:Accessory gene regulator B.
MLALCAAHITKSLIVKGYLSEKDEMIWRYALLGRIEKSLTFVSMLVLALIFHDIIGLTVYLAFLSFLREHTGGYHAKTFRGCFSFTMFTYVAIFAISRFVKPGWLVCLIFLAVSSVIILIMAPQNHPNYNGSEEEMACHRRFAIRLLAIEASLIGLINIFAGLSGLYIVLYYATYAICALVTVAMCLLLGKFFHQDRPASTDVPGQPLS